MQLERNANSENEQYQKSEKVGKARTNSTKSTSLFR